MKAKFLLPIYVLIFCGCTRKFDKINTDPTTFTSLTPAIIPNAFAKAEYQGIYGDPGIYELARALFPDYWCQFYADGGGAPSDRYIIVQDWIISQWNSVYTITVPTLKQIIAATEGTDAGENAIAKIWKVYIFHYQTDFYGPVPYFNAGNGNLSIPYDAQQDIYHDLFKVLDTAVNELKTVDAAIKPYGDNDLIFHGDVSKWLKLANTLRLRLAMRISYVEPDLAKTEAEKAVAAGVMTSNDDNAFMDVATASPNGLSLMSPWEGFRMSASMESYMKGYTDPRMQVYYSPAVSDSAYHGLRNGLTTSQLTADSRNKLDNTSNIGTKWNSNDAATNKLTVMYSAEAYFLRAEGAVNGWNMNGTAKDLYEEGIKTSMQQWGITDNTAIQNYINSTSAPIALNDFLNSPPVANIAVVFSSNPVTERQQIATQKWIALFPDGIEGWAEVRRTGYPKLYPVANSDNPDVPKDSIISRFTFLDYEYQTNGKAVQQTGIPLLHGPDKASTHVWWDVH